MPNWCINYININSKNKEGLKKLYNKIEEWTSKDYKKNDFGHNWLGNIIGFSKIDSMKDGEFINVRCRGRLDYMELTTDSLVITTETAWSPQIKMWKMIIDKYLPDAEVIYSAEECGDCLYLTNDPALINSYNITVYDSEELKRLTDVNISSVFSLHANDLVPELQKMLNVKDTSSSKDNKKYVDSLITKVLENDELSKCISINEWLFEDDFENIQ